MAFQKPLSPTSYFTTWNSKAKKKNKQTIKTPLPTQLSFKKIIALFDSHSHLSLMWGEPLPYRTHGMFQDRSQAGLAQAQSRERHPVKGLDPAVGTYPRWEKKKKKTHPDLPWHSVSTHTFSVQISLDLDDCINTGKAHSTDAHTFHSHAC